jgi:predicted O-linked N-acetylglucosamine transferase (SPINDLY family)
MILSAPSQAINEQIAQCELAIKQDDCTATNYWWLGISYLLAGDEAEAQAAWFTPIANAASEEIDILTAELTATLHQAAQDQEAVPNYPAALLIRQHLREIDPNQLENILALVLLSDRCKQLTSECLEDWELELTLAQNLDQEIDPNLLAAAFPKLLTLLDVDNVTVILDCLSYSKYPMPLLTEAQEIATKLSEAGIYEIAIPILQKCLNLSPHNFPNNYNVLMELAGIYSKRGQHQEAIKFAEQSYQKALEEFRTEPLKTTYVLKTSYVLLRILATAGKISSFYSRLENFRILIYQLIATGKTDGLLGIALSFFPYVEDQPAQNHNYLKLAGKVFQKNLRDNISPAESFANTFSAFPNLSEKPTGVLRIGYIASTLYAHSVGWLSRWLWQYHNSKQFQVFTYGVGLDQQDLVTQQWFQQKSTVMHYLPEGTNHVDRIVAQIRQDEIDILIDLDSLTNTTTYNVMARRSAPVQVTWLGWDESGAPEVDYFIADPHVLPANAEDYYSSKIWRLPQTYLAVDGFEVGTPTLRRESLGISPNAIVYYSAQVGFKLHPDTVRLQLEILRQVPDSYLLVKARVDDDAISDFYREITTEMSIDFDRLRFLGKDPNETTHRANLQIADVMLDSFPYNGATTTLETLWLGIPLVTRVGQQFAARNSYTFMVNAGITEGIAWSAAEYLEWGIRLGTDADLRQQVAGKLLDARSTAPLWNARQFTKDMEDAYRGMWEHHLEKQLENTVALLNHIQPTD